MRSETFAPTKRLARSKWALLREGSAYYVAPSQLLMQFIAPRSFPSFVCELQLHGVFCGTSKFALTGAEIWSEYRYKVKYPIKLAYWYTLYILFTCLLCT
jgi:hypothetical protein